MATVYVKLSVIGGKIHIDPDSCKVNPNDDIRWYTNESTYTFEIALHNNDGFIPNEPRIVSKEVGDSDPVTLQVNDPTEDYNVKYYSVCVLNSSTAILPPDAP
ncbi:MAG TPA: hypothetical protein VI362_08515, partial [Ignavibacteriaceae bacterium]|nr:hypothetical protein [Ignavibacteriaceae bacterium]